jgi:hypothetical protein
MMRKLGFEVDDTMLHSNCLDEGIQKACQKAAVSFATVLNGFRIGEGRRFYFELDGHFNTEGSRHYAELLDPLIVPLLTPQRPF